MEQIVYKHPDHTPGGAEAGRGVEDQEHGQDHKKCGAQDPGAGLTYLGVSPVNEEAAQAFCNGVDDPGSGHHDGDEAHGKQQVVRQIEGEEAAQNAGNAAGSAAVEGKADQLGHRELILFLFCHFFNLPIKEMGQAVRALHCGYTIRIARGELRKYGKIDCFLGRN